MKEIACTAVLIKHKRESKEVDDIMLRELAFEEALLTERSMQVVKEYKALKLPYVPEDHPQSEFINSGNKIYNDFVDRDSAFKKVMETIYNSAPLETDIVLTEGLNAPYALHTYTSLDTQSVDISIINEEDEEEVQIGFSVTKEDIPKLIKTLQEAIKDKGE